MQITCTQSRPVCDNIATCYFATEQHPQSVNTGLAVAARGIAYRQTMEQVDLAREELADGQLDRAQERLELFLTRRGEVQPA